MKENDLIPKNKYRRVATILASNRIYNYNTGYTYEDRQSRIMKLKEYHWIKRELKVKLKILQSQYLNSAWK